MKKNLLSIILAIIAMAAIVFCVVLNGQKADLQKKADELTAQVEQLKADAVKAAEEAAKAAEEAAAKAAEEAAAKAAENATESVATENKEA